MTTTMSDGIGYVLAQPIENDTLNHNSKDTEAALASANPASVVNALLSQSRAFEISTTLPADTAEA